MLKQSRDNYLKQINMHKDENMIEFLNSNNWTNKCFPWYC